MTRTNVTVTLVLVAITLASAWVGFTVVEKILDHGVTITDLSSTVLQRDTAAVAVSTTGMTGVN